jgi:hypothetical protein
MKKNRPYQLYEQVNFMAIEKGFLRGSPAEFPGAKMSMRQTFSEFIPKKF